MATLTILADEDALAREAAERMTALIERAAAARGNAVVSLTGGSTPRKLYELLASERDVWRRRIDWTRLHLFWGDERHVPPDHDDSNYGMANDALLRHVPIIPAHVHRMRGELRDAPEAAREYEQTLVEGFAAAGRGDRTFDVMLLGLGEDAHVASIFPGSELLTWRPATGRLASDERRAAKGPPADGDVVRPFTGRTERVAAVWAAHFEAWRITLTPAALLDARQICMVVAGGAKADAVRAAIDLPLDERRYPAQLLREAGDRVHWLIDRAAAGRLSSRTSSSRNA